MDVCKPIQEFADEDTCTKLKGPLAVVMNFMNGSTSGACFDASNTSGGKDVVPGLLLELVQLATQIAKMEQMREVLEKTGPTESPEAEKFHRLSVQALTCSRNTLQEQQGTLLRLLSSVTGANSPAGATSDSATKLSELPVHLGDSKSELKQTDDDFQSQCSTTISGEVAAGGRTPPSTADSDEDCFIPSSEKPVANDGIQSLRLHLEKLKEYPTGCSLQVKNIKLLGFNSATFLRDHFSQYGPVAEVLVAHSITKPSDKRKNGRVRPAAMGFVVMATTEDVKNVLDAGAQQVINGVPTEVLLVEPPEVSKGPTLC